MASNETHLITDFDTGILICNDSDKCSQDDTLCDNNSSCKDHGTCFNNLTDNTTYCSCLEGWAGPTCEDNTF
ncbi:hypothetical protein HZS_2693 [Henneguya salminicola]|nr:hypothetical protein HZS_2693 [Henneguya salminicola]